MNQFNEAVSCPKLTDQLTVIASFDAKDARLERMQALVSQWSPANDFAGFAAFDAGNTDGLNSTGYFGAVFDGRYVYFSPEQHGDRKTHGEVLRFDTQGSFKDESSWAAYDASKTGGIDTRGYYGAVFDGRYVFFIPRQLDLAEYHTRLLRYDTQGSFADSASWDVHDIGEAHSQQSAAFDGRYIYTCPGFWGVPTKEVDYCGRVLRIDTQGDFHSPDSYVGVEIPELVGDDDAKNYDGGGFDGRYVYFCPLYDGVVVRYDTTKSFEDASSWEKFDAKPLGYQLSVGCVFDGDYIYFCSYDHARMIRFDTRKPFTDESSWESYDAEETDGIKTAGFDGGFFDGRYVWYQPFFYSTQEPEPKNNFHSHYLRYDVTKPFGDSSSWQAFDASSTDGLPTFGYNAGAFDGRYFYAAPWQQGPDPDREGKFIVHGKVLRVDTLGEGNGAFSLRYCDYGHNGGLNAATPGPTFIVNTADGRSLTVSANSTPPAGKHQMAGVYDGKQIKLFIDGKCVSKRNAAGKIAESNMPVSVGRIDKGGAEFVGEIADVQILDSAMSDDEIAAAAEAFLGS